MVGCAKPSSACEAVCLRVTVVKEEVQLAGEDLSERVRDGEGSLHNPELGLELSHTLRLHPLGPLAARIAHRHCARGGTLGHARPVGVARALDLIRGAQRLSMQELGMPSFSLSHTFMMCLHGERSEL